jgi:DNA topoisomerase-1
VELHPAPGEEKPRRISLPQGRLPEDVDLDYAVRLLSLPRPLGKDPSTGDEVVAGIGRFGPFVRRGKTFASLKTEDELWGVALHDAVARLDAKASGRRESLKELGRHPETGAELVVLSGRYGPYVTDGAVNATLPKDMEPGELELDEALELLARAAARKGKGGRRGRGGSSGRAAKGSAKPKARGGRGRKRGS